MAADAGIPQKPFSIAFGPARLHFTLSMKTSSCWITIGQVHFSGSPDELSRVMASQGLKAESGRFAVRIRDCSHFVLQFAEAASYDLDADADSEQEMLRDAELVSQRLSAASVRHEFEVCGPDKETRRRFGFDG